MPPAMAAVLLPPMLVVVVVVPLLSFMTQKLIFLSVWTESHPTNAVDGMLLAVMLNSSRPWRNENWDVVTLISDRLLPVIVLSS
jgi:hypothetical protein